GRDGIVGVAADDHVIARAAYNALDVAAHVISLRSAISAVVGLIIEADHQVFGAEAIIRGVKAASAIHHIRAAFAVHVIVAGAAFQRVVAVAADQRIVAALAFDFRKGN